MQRFEEQKRREGEIRAVTGVQTVQGCVGHGRDLVYDIKNHWRILNREVTRAESVFKRNTLEVVFENRLGRRGWLERVQAEDQ